MHSWWNRNSSSSFLPRYLIKPTGAVPKSACPGAIQARAEHRLPGILSAHRVLGPAVRTCVEPGRIGMCRGGHSFHKKKDLHLLFAAYLPIMEAECSLSKPSSDEAGFHGSALTR